MIIKDPHSPLKDQITGGELTITLADFYNDQMPGLIQFFESKENNDDGGAEPIPDYGLMNDEVDSKIHVRSGKTYLVHLINVGNFVGASIAFVGHKMTIVEADGIYTDPFEVDRLYLTVGQRYSVLITTKPTSQENFLIMGQLDLGKRHHFFL
jgi:iron transport multicopper oxidase